MIDITFHDRCNCSRPRYVRSYFGRPACLCGRFIVLSETERERLKREELAELEDEKEFPLPGKLLDRLGGSGGR